MSLPLMLSLTSHVRRIETRRYRMLDIFRHDVKERLCASQASKLADTCNDQALQRRPSSDRPKSEGVLA
ncbi:hypothetical protein AT6N2_C2392 [Agrobacterium tumefaciens]|nr:hypothetical protein AT6N2_C2392 [Agrobacterium tumefaciens]